MLASTKFEIFNITNDYAENEEKNKFEF